MIGKVVSTKMNNTVVVEVDRLMVHPLYKKRLKKTSRFHAHSEEKLNLGDRVNIVESRPLSKMKRFRVKRVTEKTQEVKKK